jgi:hypothetical protein
VARQDFAEQIAKIRRHRDVAALETFVHVEPRPAAQHSAAVHRASHDEHRGGVSVVGAAVAVLTNRSAELGHRQHDDVAHPVAQIARERGERQAELAKPRRELSLARALVHMRVPSAAIGECDLQSHVRFDQLSDLQQCPTQAALRILDIAGRPVLRGVGALEHLDRLEPFPG